MERQSIPFAKGHGTGNDFVLLPDPDGALELTPEFVAGVCDRRRGVGADGVLRIVRTAKHPDAAAYVGAAEWFMDYRNADGSIVEMCGNGTRVFARYLIERGWAGAGTLPIATRSGVKIVQPAGAELAVDMGPPRLLDEARAVLGGGWYWGTRVSMGNPHLVCAVEPDVLRRLDLSAAPAVDGTVFPDGVNVEFATAPVDGVITMRVYERGVGETESCGTGACAVAAVALREAGLTTGRYAVDVPGGRLTVTLDGRTCWLAGPAVIVADGDLRLH